MVFGTPETYMVVFLGKVIQATVTHNPDVVTHWINVTKSIHQIPGLVVGLDVQWRPYYSPQPPNAVATLQLCVANRCLIYQIIHSDDCIPEALANFLSREFNYITFVGVRIRSSLEKLLTDYGIGASAFYVDLRALAANAYAVEELEMAELEELARVVLGVVVERQLLVRITSRWDDLRLTVAQVKRACIDAHVCFQIARALGLGSGC